MKVQQELWKGDFGDSYHVRNERTIRPEFWYDVLKGHMMDMQSVLELGAGKGDNLISIRNLSPWANIRLTGVDINKSACEAMVKEGIVGINGVFPHFAMDNRYDLVLTRGFLIHVPTSELDATLDKIYELSNRFIAFAEYYTPNRRRVSYRGHRNAMWTGDYAGMLMKRYHTLRLIRSGFYYQDGITWFLMEK